MTRMDDDATRAEDPPLRSIAASDFYLAALLAEVGEPTAEERARAQEIARCLSRRA